jgi:cation diffusion facilitator CzcD-associated flavoprotein CzcO
LQCLLAMERVEVAIVGGGAGGLALGARLRAAGETSFAILERDEGVGGTWRANTYPGCACDIPSHLYSFSFFTQGDWSRRYPTQPEMLRYFERLTDAFGLRPHLRLRTEVRDARFDPAAGRWRVRTDRGELDARVLVTACGQLRIPHVPAYAGLGELRAPHWHSARWRHDVDLAGKRVAVVGSGATAIQIVPEIARDARRVHVFQRSAPWVVPRRDRPYTRLERRLYGASPAARRAYRAAMFWQRELNFRAFRPSTPMSKLFVRIATKHLEEQVPDVALRERLLPDYPVGCKRVLISDDWYPALQQPNVELVTDPIERFVPEGVRTRDGALRELDAVVFATGFDSQALVAPMRIEGPDGVTLDERWEGGPRAHLGLTVAGMPNLFLLYGPNTNLGHNSILFMLECQIAYVLECLEELWRRGARALEVRAEAMERFDARVQEELRSSVWNGGCSNWYKTDDGRITNNWSGPCLDYWRATRRPHFGEYAFA